MAYIVRANIGIIVVADNEEEAKQYAYQAIDWDLNAEYIDIYSVEKVGDE